MTLVGEAARERYVGDRRFRFGQQPLGVLDTAPHEPNVRRLPGRLLECAREMTTRKPAFVGEFDKRNVALDSFVHEVFRSALLPWRQPAAACNRWRSHAAVGLSEMSLQCEYRMVQEQHAGVFRVFQRGENRQPQMVCDGIDFPMRPRQAADLGSAVIVGYFIEGRSRQMEMDGVRTDLARASMVVAPDREC